jgi:hypothetical protein
MNIFFQLTPDGSTADTTTIQITQGQNETLDFTIYSRATSYCVVLK